MADRERGGRIPADGGPRLPHVAGRRLARECFIHLHRPAEQIVHVGTDDELTRQMVFQMYRSATQILDQEHHVGRLAGLIAPHAPPRRRAVDFADD